MSNIGLDHLEMAMGLDPEHAQALIWDSQSEGGGTKGSRDGLIEQKIKMIIEEAQGGALNLKQKLDQLPPTKRRRTVRRLLDMMTSFWS